MEWRKITQDISTIVPKSNYLDHQEKLAVMKKNLYFKLLSYIRTFMNKQRLIIN